MTQKGPTTMEATGLITRDTPVGHELIGSQVGKQRQHLRHGA